MTAYVHTCNVSNATFSYNNAHYDNYVKLSNFKYCTARR